MNGRSVVRISDITFLQRPRCQQAQSRTRRLSSRRRFWHSAQVRTRYERLLQVSLLHLAAMCFTAVVHRTHQKCVCELCVSLKRPKIGQHAGLQAVRQQTSFRRRSQRASLGHLLYQPYRSFSCFSRLLAEAQLCTSIASIFPKLVQELFIRQTEALQIRPAAPQAPSSEKMPNTTLSVRRCIQKGQ